MSESNDTKDRDQAELALREGLRARTLSPEAMQRIRAATEQEWRANVQAPVRAPSRRRWLSLAAAASVAALAGVVGWNVYNANNAADRGAVLGQLARVEAPGIVEIRLPAPGRRDEPGGVAGRRTILRRSRRFADHAYGWWQPAGRACLGNRGGGGQCSEARTW